MGCGIKYVVFFWVNKQWKSQTRAELPGSNDIRRADWLFEKDLRCKWDGHGEIPDQTKSSQGRDSDQILSHYLNPPTLNHGKYISRDRSSQWTQSGRLTMCSAVLCQHLWERTAPTELIWLNPCVNVCQICVWFSCWPAAYAFRF